MSTRSPRMRGLLDLWAAHRELSTLEWLEFQQTLRAAALWAACATLLGMTGWLSLNAALVFALRERPLHAFAALVAVNLLGALVAGLQVRRLLRRPFFELTKREAGYDVNRLLKLAS